MNLMKEPTLMSCPMTPDTSLQQPLELTEPSQPGVTPVVWTLWFLMLFPATAMAELRDDTMGWTNEISDFLCGDLDYLACIESGPTKCADRMQAAVNKCGQAPMILSDGRSPELQIQRRLTNCLISTHTESLKQEFSEVESCYLKRKNNPEFVQPGVHVQRVERRFPAR